MRDEERERTEKRKEIGTYKYTKRERMPVHPHNIEFPGKSHTETGCFSHGSSTEL